MEDLVIKAATIIAVAIAAFSSFPSTAQPNQDQQPPQAQVAQQESASRNASSSSPAAPEQDARRGTETSSTRGEKGNAIQLKPVKGELVGKLDSKSAKQGDSVVLKTEESVKTTNGAEIPKGSKLIGHVTNVEQRGNGKQNAQIAIQFDRAELKGGKNLRIESVIQALAPAGGNGTENNNGASSVAAGIANDESRAQRESAGSSAAQEPESGKPASGAVVARNGNVAIRATQIPGILLANEINGQPFTNASGLVLGARRDIELEGGTQMVVAVGETPSGMSR